MGKITTNVHLSLGSNLGNRLANLSDAIAQLQDLGSIESLSKVYECEPLGMEAEQDFLNLALTLRTNLTPLELLAANQSIENRIGRIKTQSGTYESRVIDIDIIFFGEEIIDSQSLEVPHPEYGNRKFVLLPLKEIDPEFIDPKSGNSIDIVLKNCRDTSNIYPHTENIHLYEL